MATGFGKDGLTYGASAANIISDQIVGTASKKSALFNIDRIKSIKPSSFYNQLEKQNSYQYRSISEIPLDSGGLFSEAGHKLAVYKNENNSLKVCSAKCPHLGGHVAWNDSEKTWDCPNHGSRFQTTGEVIEGPALNHLTRFQNLEKQEVKKLDIKDDFIKEHFEL